MRGGGGEMKNLLFNSYGGLSRGRKPPISFSKLRGDLGPNRKRIASEDVLAMSDSSRLTVVLLMEALLICVKVLDVR